MQQTVFLNLSLPIELRYLAIIQLKNGIDKYWRRAAASSIKRDEKALIRSRCLESGFNEPDHRIALQNAVMIAKIVRIDYPQDWYVDLTPEEYEDLEIMLIHIRSEVFKDIVTALRLTSFKPQNSLQFSRTLLILLQAIKEIWRKRFRLNREAFSSEAKNIINVLGTIYVKKVTIWKTFLEEGGDDEGGALDSIEQSLFALRILRRLVITGYETPSSHSEALELWTEIGNQFGQMLSLVLPESFKFSLSVKQLIEKHVIQIAKLHLDMVKIHPTSFALFPNSIELVRVYWKAIVQFGGTFGSQTATPSARIGNDGDAEDEEISALEKVSLKGLLILRACIKMVFSPNQIFKNTRIEVKQDRIKSVKLIKSGLLTETFAREVMETLVTRFFVFRSRDLRDWEEEPGEWERREEGEGDVWEFSIRSCSEKLFLDLMIYYQDLLVQPLLDVFYNVASMFDVSSSKSSH